MSFQSISDFDSDALFQTFTVRDSHHSLLMESQLTPLPGSDETEKRVVPGKVQKPRLRKGRCVTEEGMLKGIRTI